MLHRRAFAQVAIPCFVGAIGAASPAGAGVPARPEIVAQHGADAPGEAARRRRSAERFLEHSRRPPRWQLDLPLALAVVILGVGLLVVVGPWVRRRAGRRGVAGRSGTDEPGVLAPTLRFRGRPFAPRLEPDSTVVWEPGEATGVFALPSQVALARALGPSLERALESAAAELERTHAPWLEGHSTAALATELRVTALRVPPDAKDATVYASHRAFSGHVVEITLRPSGAVSYVGLLG